MFSVPSQIVVDNTKNVMKKKLMYVLSKIAVMYRACDKKRRTHSEKMSRMEVPEKGRKDDRKQDGRT